MKYAGNCPNCGRFVSVSLSKKDKRQDLQIACKHCGNSAKSGEWMKYTKRVDIV